MAAKIDSLRNIGIIAHIDAGKTTTTERILYYTQKSHKIGEVDAGTATMDWMSQEQNRGITIVSAATTCYWNNVQLNIIDTPGHVDFTAEVERSIRVLDGAVGIFCAVGGVEPQSETVWRQADHYSVPRLAYINKLDRIGADFFGVLDEIEKKLEIETLPLSLPIGKEANYSGNIDIIGMREVYWDLDATGLKVRYGEISKENKEIAEKWRQCLIDRISNYSEEITNLYLEGSDINGDLIRREIRKATIENKILPVLAGSSLKNKGVQPLLDAIVDYLPDPQELKPISTSESGHIKTVELKRSPDEKLASLVFKIQHDREMGLLSYVRVYSGILKSGTMVQNVNLNTKERVNRLLRMHANHYEKVSEIGAGDIGVAIGLRSPRTGDTLTAAGSNLLLESMQFPEPVISVAIEPKTKSDQQKLDDALDKLKREDPTFTARQDVETGQQVISGMGELHIEVLVTRITEDFNVSASIGKPQVTYRETIKQKVLHTETYNRILAGREHYASVTLEVYPRASGAGNEFEKDDSVKNLPKEYLAAIRRGVEAGFSSGIVLGYPCADVGVVLIEFDFQDIKASEVAFETAASLGFDSACRQAAPALLEPIMHVDVTSPKAQVGDVIGNLTQRKGHILSLESRTANELVKANIPLSRMFGYSTTLRSLTQGRGMFYMEFSHFSIKNDSD